MPAAQSGTFFAQVSAWVALAKARELAVFQESTQRLIEFMQTPVGGGGNMPVDTGFLRASLTVVRGKVDGLPAIAPVSRASVAYDISSVAVVLAGVQIGDTITAIYLANYARRVNYGFVGTDKLGRRYNHSGYLFVEQAAQQWQNIVHAVTLELKSRSKTP